MTTPTSLLKIYSIENDTNKFININLIYVRCVQIFCTIGHF